MEGSRLRRRSVFVLVGSVGLIVIGLTWSKDSAPSRQDIGLLVAIAGLLVLLYGCVFLFPTLFAASPGRSPSKLDEEVKQGLDYLTLENSIRGTLLQVVLGIGVIAAAVTAWTQFTGAAEQLQLTRQQFASGQFSDATGLLSKSDLESRLSGLYTFQRLLRTTKEDDEMGRKDNLAAYQLLAAFIKAHSPWPPLKSFDEDQRRRGVQQVHPLALGSLRKRSSDVQLALEIVGADDKLIPQSEEKTYTAFLTNADLRGAALGNLHLSRADLRATFLDYADGRVSRERQPKSSYPDLSGASLQGASFRCAQLQGTNFQNAQMDGVDIRGADLRRIPPPSPGESSTQQDANLYGASLRGAIWNEQTQWPEGFNPAGNPDLVKDEQLLAHAPDGTDVLVVMGGKVDTQERWEQGDPISMSRIFGGYIVGRLKLDKQSRKWKPLAQQMEPSTTELRPLACEEYKDYGYWPDSINHNCPAKPKRHDLACPGLAAPTVPKPPRGGV